MDNSDRTARQPNAQYDDVLFQGQFPVTLSAVVSTYDTMTTVWDISTMFVSTENYNEVLWDTGATSSVTFNKEDFVHDTFVPETGLSVMKGLAKGLDIKGSGTIKYGVLDKNNIIVELTSRAYYVPTATRRIFSPQAFFQHPTTSRAVISSQNHLGINLTIPNDKKESNIVSILYNSRNNLPTFYACQVGTSSATAIPTVNNIDSDSIQCYTTTINTVKTGFSNIMSHVTEVVNTNLSSAQKLLMTWHFRLGHFNLRAVQQVIRSGCLGTTPALRAAAKCAPPKCASCLFSKARRRTVSMTSNVSPNPHHSLPTAKLYNPIARNEVFPGSAVSVDHFKVTTPGRLLETRGSTSVDKTYKGGCIFVDHATGFIFVHLEIHQTASETVQGKQQFERHLFEYGVSVQKYQGDNLVFSSREFTLELLQNHQLIHHSGVGGHHQNGIAERSIGTILSMARTMLIHAMIRWPEVIKLEIWPMAVTYAVWIYNRMPKTNGLSPLELLTSSKYSRNGLMNCRVFGSPAYVLDPKLHNAGGFIPKFSPRSRRGVFLGISAKHSSTIPLILNLDTLAITSQYHVVFDDEFTTVTGEEISNVDEKWLRIFNTDRYKYEFEDDDETWDPVPWSDERSRILDQQIIQEEIRPDRVIPMVPETPVSQPKFEERLIVDSSPIPINLQLDTPVQVELNSPTKIEETSIPVPSTLSSPEKSPGKVQVSTPILRRSTRNRVPPNRYIEETSNYNYTSEWCEKAEEEIKLLVEIYTSMVEKIGVNDDIPYLISSMTDRSTFSIEYDDPVIYAAVQNHLSPVKDILRYHEAIIQPDWEYFRDAAQNEIKTLQSMQTWIEIPRRLIPSNAKVLDGTWVFARKRNPEGEITKYKGRFCVRGDQQQYGIDYFVVYC